MHSYPPSTFPRSHRSHRAQRSSRLGWRSLIGALVGIRALALPVGLHAQADRIDAGSFSVRMAGERIGREQFSIRKAPAPDGAAFELRAETTQGDRRVAVQLTTDSTGAPIRYSLEIRDDANVMLRLGGQRVRGRFAVLARKPTGEVAREFLLDDHTLIVDPELFHQLCFVVRGRGAAVGETASVSVLSPQGNAEQALQVKLESLSDTVTIAGVVKQGRRWRLDDAAGLTRMVWADSDGRILRVTIPGRQIEAIRDDIPRP